MASDFIGARVLVTLQARQNAPGAPPVQIKGTVANILGQRLSLTDTFLWDGRRVPTYQIDSAAIADLEIEKNQENAPGANPHLYTGTSTNGSDVASVKPEVQPFADPAILSFSRPPLVTNHSNIVAAPAQVPKLTTTLSTDSVRAKKAVPTFSHPISSISTSSYGPPATTLSQRAERKDSVATATLHEPFSHSELQGESELDGNNVEVTRMNNVADGRIGDVPIQEAGKFTGKRSRRGKGKLSKDGQVQNDHTPAVAPGDAVPFQKKSQFKAKGWRQTPLVEEQPPPEPTSQRHGYGPHNITTAFQKKGARRKQKFQEEQNGWATEDATDIQDMGEFDFEGNLSKFDKRKVFAQIRNDDTTADEDRLISHNRKPRPGTNGGKNLHYTENVLDSPSIKPKWISEETDEDEHASSGRLSRSAVSRASNRQMSSRKGSAIAAQAPLPALHVSSIGRAQYASSRTESPRPTKTFQSATSPLNGSIVLPSKASFRLTGSNRPCPCIGPLQMLEIEQLSVSELGVSEEIITENAGRGIAEAALMQAADTSYSINILLLVGNHKTGARAIAAARHLRNRNIRATVCILGGEREHEFLDSMRRQLEMYRKVGGRVSRWDDLSEKLNSTEWTMDLVVDALFGMHISFEDLRMDDSATAFEMISWVNRSEANILSVDVPSGLMAATGEISTTESGALLIQPHFVLSLGAPKVGLLNALVNEAPGSAGWQLSVADVGISNVAWKKYGSRRRQGVDWGGQWVVGFRFVVGK